MQVLRSYDELKQWAKRPIYLTVGFFDGVHLGHQHLLGQLKAAASSLQASSVALTFSNSPKRFHQPHLRGPEWHYLTTADEKLELIAQTGIDATLMIEYNAAVAANTASEFLIGVGRHARLAGLLVGYDTSLGSDMVSGEQPFETLCEWLGIAMTFVDPLLVDGEFVKSSRIRALVQMGDLPAAARLLGRPYAMRGEVVRGKGKGGAMLGIPTANLSLPPEKFLPPLGVYAGVGEVDGARYPAAICLSSAQQHSSTVLDAAEETGQSADDAPPVPEAHLAGFSGEIYGRQLRLEVTQRLRGWADFVSADELRRQMQTDIEQAVRIAEEVKDA